MSRRNGFIVSVFLVFSLALSGVLCAQRVIDLDKVWGDMRVLGRNAGDIFGAKLDRGDINGDGYQDIIIGAYCADPKGRNFAGETYVIFGSSSPPSTIDLSTQSANITICGAAANDYLGRSVASGDVNGDGYDDIIIGADGADPYGRSGAGKTYVIFGGSQSSPVTIDLNTDSADITICGKYENDDSAYAVASGNVNADAYDDIIISALYADPGTPVRTNAGETYVIFGKSFASPTTIDLSTGFADITICGDDAGDSSGAALSSGDVNGDGLDDVIIGAQWAPQYVWTGESYVIFGFSPSSPVTIDLSTTPADITVYGTEAWTYCGHDVDSGDVNGDGYDDLIISAITADPAGGTSAGETYVIFGKNFSSPTTIELSTHFADITIGGDDSYDNSGYGVSSDDVNGDGYDDIIIGAMGADPLGGSLAGESYVVFGGSFPSPPYTIDLNSQSADICIYGDDGGDQSGWTVTSGDVNGDGYDDIIIGALNADPGGRTDAGETYVILGGGSFIVSHGLGGKSWINGFSLLGRGWGGFKAFKDANSQGEVHLAVGDIDADSLDEIAAGHGEGGKSWVKFFEVNGSLISTFKAFGAANTNGELHLTIGNFNAEPSDTEIAAAQGEGGHSWVKVFETDGTLITTFKAFGDVNAQGEVHLAAGDLENADEIDEMIAGTGEGGSSWVKIFSHEGILIRSFKAFGAANIGGEVHVAVGNFDADSDLEIAAASGYNGNNLVKLFDKDGTFIRQFKAFGTAGNTNGEVQIAAADIDNDGIDEITCGHGEGGNSGVRVFKADGTAILSFKAFGGVNAQGEVHLGKSNY